MKCTSCHDRSAKYPDGIYFMCALCYEKYLKHRQKKAQLKDLKVKP